MGRVCIEKSITGQKIIQPQLVSKHLGLNYFFDLFLYFEHTLMIKKGRFQHIENPKI